MFGGAGGGAGDQGLTMSASNMEGSFSSRPQFGEASSFASQGAFGDHRESFGGGSGSGQFSGVSGGEQHQSGGSGNFETQRGFGEHQGFGTGGGGGFQQHFSGFNGNHRGVGGGVGAGNFGEEMLGSASTQNFNFFNNENDQKKLFEQNIRNFGNNGGHGSFNLGGVGGGGQFGAGNFPGQFGGMGFNGGGVGGSFVDDGEKLGSESVGSSFVKENFVDKQPLGVPNGYGNQAVYSDFNSQSDAQKEETGESGRDTGFALLSALSNPEFSRDFFQPGPGSQQQQRQHQQLHLQQNKPPMPPQLAFLNSMLKDNMNQRPSASEFRPFKAQDFSDFYVTSKPDQDQSKEEQRPQSFQLSKPIDITLLSDVEPLDAKLISSSSSSHDQKEKSPMLSLLADYLKNGSPSYEQQSSSSQPSFSSSSLLSDSQYSSQQLSDQSSYQKPAATYNVKITRPPVGSSGYTRPPIIIYQGIKPPIYVYKKTQQGDSKPYKGPHLAAKVVSGDRDFSAVYERYMRTKLPNYKITGSDNVYSRPISVGMVSSDAKIQSKKAEGTLSPYQRRDPSYRIPKKDSYFVVTKTSGTSPRSDTSSSYSGIAQSSSEIQETWIPIRQRSRKTASGIDATTAATSSTVDDKNGQKKKSS